MAAEEPSTCAMLIDFGNGRILWADVPVIEGMNGFDVYENATSELGLAETSVDQPPYGHYVMNVDGYVGNYNYSSPESPYDFWRLLKWNDDLDEWTWTSTMIDGIDPLATKAIALMYTKYPYMGPPMATPDHRDPWISERHDFLNSGSALSYNASGVEMKWRLDLGNGAIDAPVISGAGRLYVVSSGVHNEATDTYETNSTLYCFAQSGDVLWREDVGSGHQDAAPLLWDGTVYVHSADGILYAFNAENGHLKWTYCMGKTDGNVTSPIVCNNLIIISGNSGELLALTKNGVRFWSMTVPSTFISSPAAFNDLLFVGGDNGTLYAMACNGSGEVWNVPIGGTITGSPVILDDRIVTTYTNISNNGPSGGGMTAVSYDGEILWQSPTAYTPGSAAVTSNGVVAVSSEGMTLVSLDGQTQWTTPLESSDPGGSPLAISGMTLVVTKEDSSRILAINNNGFVEWEKIIDPAQTITSSPSISDNVLYLTSSDGSVYAYLFEDLQWSIPPVSSFAYAVNGSTVHFDGSLSYGGEGELTYNWSFGDGQMANGMSVDHTYENTTERKVTLIVTDSAGVRCELAKMVVLNVTDKESGPEPGEVSDDPASTSWIRSEWPIWGTGTIALGVILAVILGIRRAKIGKN
jgi:outer membrane protein assembly factor BamB